MLHAGSFIPYTRAGAIEVCLLQFGKGFGSARRFQLSFHLFGDEREQIGGTAISGFVAESAVLSALWMKSTKIQLPVSAAKFWLPGR